MCKYCNDFFESKSIIQNSTPMETGVKLSIDIEVCGSELHAYIINNIINTHNKIEASESRVFSAEINFCPMCGKSLRSVNNDVQSNNQ